MVDLKELWIGLDSPGYHSCAMEDTSSVFVKITFIRAWTCIRMGQNSIGGPHDEKGDMGR